MLGILLLLPVMVNISLIDVFYGIAGGATANAILFTVALTYLLALQWPAIREFFRQTRSGLPAIRGNIAKNLLRLALTTWAIGFIAYVASRKEPAAFTGKWRVDQLVRNHHAYAPDDWVTDSLDWKYIYLEQFGRATFSPNPLVVDPRSTKAIYSVDPGEQSMRVTLLNRPLNHSAADTALVKLTTSPTGHMQWTLIDHPDTIDLSLTKIDMTH